MRNKETDKAKWTWRKDTLSAYAIFVPLMAAILCCYVALLWTMFGKWSSVILALAVWFLSGIVTWVYAALTNESLRKSVRVAELLGDLRTPAMYCLCLLFGPAVVSVVEDDGA